LVIGHWSLDIGHFPPLRPLSAIPGFPLTFFHFFFPFVTQKGLYS